MSRGKRLNPFEHVLQRPDTYIGSINTVEKDVWIYNKDSKVMELKKIPYNSGLFNIIREIGSNCIDNKWKSETTEGSPPMTKIKIDVTEDGTFTFWNDGYCIPISPTDYEYTNHRTNKKTTETMYPAEMFFGEMLAGTNFETEGVKDSRKTSGKNGMGSKATNVFSTSFEIEHTSTDDKKKFVQNYSNNAKERSEPNVTSFRGKTGYTQIKFKPDYEKFAYPNSEQPEIDENLIDVIRTYAIEIAMVTSLPVFFNKEKYQIPDLEKYARLFHPDKRKYKSLLFKNKEGDECLLMERDHSPSDDIKSISFVNGINTCRGGIHVNSWRDAIIPSLVKAYNAQKTKGGKNAVKLKTNAKIVYSHLLLFVRCELNKPTFDTQTKDYLNGWIDEETNKKSNLPLSTVKPTSQEIEDIMKNWKFIKQMTEDLLSQHQFSLMKKEKVSNTNRIVSKKYDAANMIKKEPRKCTLWLTEGDSARALAIALICLLPGGRDYNGVYALRGKLLNVSANNKIKIANNEEIQMIQKILGTDPSLDYSKEENIKKLNYGAVNLFTDADVDGIHIRGLILNFFYRRFHGLCNSSKFSLQADNTPVAKAFKGKKLYKVFYTTYDYKKWCEEDPNASSCVTKFYKGLGAIKPPEIPDLVTGRKTVSFYLEGDEANYMDLAFSKEKGETDRRKEWVVRDNDDSGDIYKESVFAYEGKVSFSDFIDTQLICFQKESLPRAIPSLCDSFKESLRKVFYALRKLNITDEKKVLQIIGAVYEHSAYEHGDASLGETIIKMAQGYVNSNNIPLLKDAGQFGTRLQGGKDHSQTRYISSCLDKVSEYLYPKVDDFLLDFLKDGKQIIEPKYYMSIIPMILVNGCSGIATGYSTYIPPYNPLDLCKWIKQWIKGRKTPQLVPWWRNFTGNIELNKVKEKGREISIVTTEGILEKEVNPRSGKPTGWYIIRELPIGLWTNDFKNMCEELCTNTKKTVRGKEIKKTAVLKDVIDHSTPNTVLFKIKPGPDFIPDIDTPKNPFSCLKSSERLSNMHVLNEKGYPMRFDSPEEIMEYFCQKRYELYTKRKEFLLGSFRRDLKKTSNRYRFVKAVVDKKLNMYQEDEELEGSMLEMKLEKIDGSFDYLLSMHMRSMTKKKLEELKKEINNTKEQIANLKDKNEGDLWTDDIQKFEKYYPTFLKSRENNKKRK